MRNIFLEDSTGECLHDIGVGKDFLNSTKSTKYSRKKRDKSDYINIKNFYSSKNTIKGKKRQAAKWEETLKYRYLTRKTKTFFQNIYRGLVNHERQVND